MYSCFQVRWMAEVGKACILKDVVHYRRDSMHVWVQGVHLLVVWQLFLGTLLTFANSAFATNYVVACSTARGMWYDEMAWCSAHLHLFLIPQHTQHTRTYSYTLHVPLLQISCQTTVIADAVQSPICGVSNHRYGETICVVFLLGLLFKRDSTASLLHRFQHNQKQ